ncbi:hypothetical protein AAG598_07945 [Citromicrobium bathyomarinum]
MAPVLKNTLRIGAAVTSGAFVVITVIEVAAGNEAAVVVTRNLVALCATFGFLLVAYHVLKGLR